MPADISQADMLDTVVRAAMKREYDKGGVINNAGAFASAVRRRELDNDAAVQGSLRLSYRAALKLLGEDDATDTPTDVAAYSQWQAPDDGPVASLDDKQRWAAIQLAIGSLPRDHALGQAVRETCNHETTSDAEEAEFDALKILDYLEAVALDTGIHLERDPAARRSVQPAKRPMRGDLAAITAPAAGAAPPPDIVDVDDTGEDPPPDTLAAA